LWPIQLKKVRPYFAASQVVWHWLITIVSHRSHFFLAVIGPLSGVVLGPRRATDGAKPWGRVGPTRNMSASLRSLPKFGTAADRRDMPISDIALSGEQRRGHFEAERLRGDQVGYEVKLGWLLHRDVGGLHAAQNSHAATDGGFIPGGRRSRALSHTHSGTPDIGTAVRCAAVLSHFPRPWRELQIFWTSARRIRIDKGVINTGA